MRMKVQSRCDESVCQSAAARSAGRRVRLKAKLVWEGVSRKSDRYSSAIFFNCAQLYYKVSPLPALSAGMPMDANMPIMPIPVCQWPMANGEHKHNVGWNFYELLSSFIWIVCSFIMNTPPRETKNAALFVGFREREIQKCILQLNRMHLRTTLRLCQWRRKTMTLSFLPTFVQIIELQLAKNGCTFRVEWIRVRKGGASQLEISKLVLDHGVRCNGGPIPTPSR